MVLLDTYDKKSGVHSYWISETIESAFRALRSLAVSGKDSLPVLYPQDFEIIHVADFDSGSVTPVIKILGSFGEVVENG